MTPQKPTPPQWLDKLLERFCAPHLLEEVLGDLHERYYLRAERVGERQAKRQYWREVLAYMRPAVFKRPSSQYNKPIPMDMLKNYFKIAFRNLLNERVYSTINILGLSIGMACCLLIFQYVAFEYSFDLFHKHEPNLYRVLQSGVRGGEELDQGHAYTAQSLAPALAEGVPELSQITRLHTDNIIISLPAYPEKVFEEEDVLYVDPGFLKMFTFPLVAGDVDKALKPGTALLSESAAEKYFREANPVGQVLEVIGQIEKSYRVAGIFQDVPANSHLQFEVLLPMDDLLRGENYSNEPEGGWSWNNFSTYVQLHPDADLAEAERKMTQVYLDHRGEWLRQQGFKSALHMQPFKDVHLNAEITGSVDVVMGSYRTVYFFMIIGLITLGIALVNYVNLATARALNRAQEVGVRKVVGAQRGQLIVQFLCESALTNVTAAALAVALVAWLTPVVNDLAEAQLTLSLWMNPNFWAAFLFTLCTGTLLAGLYPALVLSSFKPIAALKSKAGSFVAQLWLRRGLVVLQFTASVVLVAGTVVVYNQLSYMRGMDLGLDLEQVLTIEGPRVLPEETDRAAVTATFLQELRRLPAVRQVAASSTLPGQGFNWNGASIRKATDDPANAIRGVATYIDTTFANLYGLELMAGNGFEDITLSDAEDAPWTVITNETAVKALGFTSPIEAVDQMLDIGGYEARIIGVYKDFHWSSAHGEQQSIIFGPTSTGRHISLRIDTSDLPGAIGNVQAIYDRLFPGNVFHYAFVDEVFDQQYRNDQRFARLFNVFAGLAIFIACLGLFGLAAFTAQQRTKEIGIRKVLGASVSNIITMLSRDFLQLVIFSLIIATPIAWFTMHKWLQDFAYRIDLDWWIFALAGILALLIALFTVSVQAIKAALANPVDSLRNE